MRKILGKKGFTMIELVIVIAIIAILSAMILPTLSSKEAEKKASVSAAKDYYSAVQYLVTKYSRYEGYLSEELKQQQLGKDPDETSGNCIFAYDKALFGNYPQKKFTLIAMKVDKSQIEYVDVVALDNISLAEIALYQKDGVTTETNFERLYKSDVEPLFKAQDGMYYAYVYFENNENKATGEPNTNTVRVLASAYCPTELPPCGADFNDFKENYLLLTDNGLNAKGMFLGVCSSTKDTSIDKYLGTPGSYFSLAFMGLVSP